MFIYKIKFLNRKSLLKLILFAVLICVSTVARAQQTNSQKDSSAIKNSSRQNQQGTLAEQAANGKIPMSFANERLQPDKQKIRRLSPTILPPQSNEMGKPLQI